MRPKPNEDDIDILLPRHHNLPVGLCNPSLFLLFITLGLNHVCLHKLLEILLDLRVRLCMVPQYAATSVTTCLRGSGVRGAGGAGPAHLLHVFLLLVQRRDLLVARLHLICLRGRAEVRRA
jgi:hypothetical protein